MPDYSIVIPTYERTDVLPEVLAAVRGQRGAPPFEVVVVDDGSGDATPELLERAEAAWPADGPPLTVLRQDNRGPAAARNAGVERAAAFRVAFLGDDTVPSPGWLAAHHEAHQRWAGDPRPTAVLGYTGWHPRMRLNPFLHHINEYGLQFGYALIEEPDEVPFNFFYTSNLSLPRPLLREQPFHTGFPYPAWEDIEAGYRLTRAGLRIVYQPRATTAHHHPTDFARFAARQEKAGYSAVLFHRLHPELGPFLGLGPGGPPPLPAAGRQRLREAVVRALQLPLVRRLPVSLPGLWEETLRTHYVRGLHRGWKELGPDAVPDRGASGGHASGKDPT